LLWSTSMRFEHFSRFRNFCVGTRTKTSLFFKRSTSRKTGAAQWIWWTRCSFLEHLVTVIAKQTLISFLIKLINFIANYYSPQARDVARSRSWKNHLCPYVQTVYSRYYIIYIIKILLQYRFLLWASVRVRRVVAYVLCEPFSTTPVTSCDRYVRYRTRIVADPPAACSQHNMKSADPFLVY